MKLLAEIQRIDRRPVGMICQNSNSKQIGFSPTAAYFTPINDEDPSG